MKRRNNPLLQQRLSEQVLFKRRRSAVARKSPVAGSALSGVKFFVDMSIRS
jgi:hypothetical protein